MTLLVRALQLLPPESAHRLALRALPWWPMPKPAPSPRLACTLLGRDLPNPIGLAAGFDKDAEAFAPLLGLGFGFVEIGTVTPKPQPGNPRPRLFRLVEDGALINRMGFNGEGLEVARRRLATRDPAAGMVGANIGMNKGTEDPVADYLAVFAGLHDLVDYVTVNLSSPNTPGLRALQAREPLARLLGALLDARAKHSRPRPLLLKIAPDLTPEDEDDIAAVALDLGLDGLIVSNTTIARPETLKGAHKNEAGGLSGRPLMAPSTALLARMAARVGGRLTLIGVGGIFHAGDVRAKLAAGASAVQLYTGFVYGGPGLPRDVCAGLDAMLAREHRASVAEAVGNAPG